MASKKVIRAARAARAAQAMYESSGLMQKAMTNCWKSLMTSVQTQRSQTVTLKKSPLCLKVQH